MHGDKMIRPIFSALTITVSLALAASSSFAEQVKIEDMVVIDGVSNVEDLISINDTWIYGTSFSPAAEPTGLYLFNAQTKGVSHVDWSEVKSKPDTTGFPQCPGKPDFALLSTHGLDYDASSHRLYVITHGSREAIEVFELGLPASGKPVLTWIGCVIAPEHTYLDAVAGIEGGSIIASSLWDPEDPERETKQANGDPVGSALTWTSAQGWKPIPGSETLSGPNGLVATHDGKNIYVAVWAGQYIARFTHKDGNYELTRGETLPYRPDNLRWSPDRKTIYSGGQVASYQTMSNCLGGAEPSCPDVRLQLDAIDPATLTAREIIPAGTYKGLNTGTGAIRVGDSYWLSTFKNTLIGVVPVR